MSKHTSGDIAGQLVGESGVRGVPGDGYGAPNDDWRLRTLSRVRESESNRDALSATRAISAVHKTEARLAEGGGATPYKRPRRKPLVCLEKLLLLRLLLFPSIFRQPSDPEMQLTDSGRMIMKPQRIRCLVLAAITSRAIHDLLAEMPTCLWGL